MKCKRCNTSEGCLVSRNETFCGACFSRFVLLKFRKQMMLDEYYQQVFKVLYADKNRTAEEADEENARSVILVPLSLGSSSLAMLDLLNQTLIEQRSAHNRTGFQVKVVLCGFSTEMDELKKLAGWLQTERLAANADCIDFYFLDLDRSFSDCEVDKLLLASEGYDTRKVTSTGESATLSDILDQFSGRSSRDDMLCFARQHLIKRFASQHQVKVIMWGHSVTRLADEIVSLVIKGRGAQIASALNSTDMDAEYGALFKNLYPLRDVLLSELDAYCTLANLQRYIYNYSLQDSLFIKRQGEATQANRAVSMAKNMTINELTRQYFDAVEKDYSNVISTIVRTGSKLDYPNASTADVIHCSICNNRVYIDASKWLKSITVNDCHPPVSDEDLSMLQMWEASSKGQETIAQKHARSDIWSAATEAPLCYGCIVTLNETKEKELNWPSRENEVSEVLAEFTLTDEV
ncbi:AaceriACR271Cp [[Ashbya] aceris (nom. inval.)]|nr:AaceriACR271Cp [[Ashbya] aceris (nom. inval.)]